MSQGTYNDSVKTMLHKIRQISVDAYNKVNEAPNAADNIEELSKVLEVVRKPRVLDKAPAKINSMKSEGLQAGIEATIHSEYAYRYNDIKSPEECFVELVISGSPKRVKAPREFIALMRTILTLSTTTNTKIHETYAAIFKDLLMFIYNRANLGMEITLPDAKAHVVEHKEDYYTDAIRETLRDLLEEGSIKKVK